MTQQISGALKLKIVRRHGNLMFECLRGKMYSVYTNRPRKYGDGYQLASHDSKYIPNYYVRITRGRTNLHCYLSGGQQRDNVVFDLYYGSALQKFQLDELRRATRLDETQIQLVPEGVFEDVPEIFRHVHGTCDLSPRDFKEGDVVTICTL